MAKKVTVDNLADEVSKILDEYTEDIQENIEIINRKIGQKGAQALRNESKEKFNSQGNKYKYAKGWTYTTEHTRLYTVVTIHNKSQAGLAHLLEFGHVSANGYGRNYQTDKAPVAGRAHIEPVEQELILSYENEVKSII